MDAKRWELGVRLDMPEGSQFVLNTVQAANVLLIDWPERTSKAYRRAAQVCMSVLSDALPARLAQEAFILAAIHAAIPISLVERSQVVAN